MTVPAAVCVPLADIVSLPPSHALHFCLRTAAISLHYLIHQSQVLSGRHPATLQPETLRGDIYPFHSTKLYLVAGNVAYIDYALDTASGLKLHCMLHDRDHTVYNSHVQEHWLHYYKFCVIRGMIQPMKPQRPIVRVHEL